MVMLSEPRPVDDATRAERMRELWASLEGHRRRHESARTFPALHGFALAEAAVRDGRAEWLPIPTA
jgi:hypothetical protein